MNIRHVMQIVVVLFAVSGCEDAEQAARKLAVEAKEKFAVATNLPNEERLVQLLEVKEMIRGIVDKYKESEVAYELASTGVVVGIDVDLLDGMIDGLEHHLSNSPQVSEFLSMLEGKSPEGRVLTVGSDRDVCLMAWAINYWDLKEVEILARTMMSPKGKWAVFANTKTLEQAEQLVVEHFGESYRGLSAKTDKLVDDYFHVHEDGCPDLIVEVRNLNESIRYVFPSLAP